MFIRGFKVYFEWTPLSGLKAFETSPAHSALWSEHIWTLWNQCRSVSSQIWFHSLLLWGPTWAVDHCHHGLQDTAIPKLNQNCDSGNRKTKRATILVAKPESHYSLSIWRQNSKDVARSCQSSSATVLTCSNLALHNHSSTQLLGGSCPGSKSGPFKSEGEKKHRSTEKHEIVMFIYIP